MSELGDLMPDMSVGKPHKYILYISTVVLLLALFVQAKVYSNELIVGKSIWIIFWSMAMWLINKAIQAKISYLAHKSRSDRQIRSWVTTRRVLEAAYVVTVFFVIA